MPKLTSLKLTFFIISKDIYISRSLTAIEYMRCACYVVFEICNISLESIEQWNSNKTNPKSWSTAHKINHKDAVWLPSYLPPPTKLHIARSIILFIFSPKKNRFLSLALCFSTREHYHILQNIINLLEIRYGDMCVKTEKKKKKKKSCLTFTGTKQQQHCTRCDFLSRSLSFLTSISIAANWRLYWKL